MQDSHILSVFDTSTAAQSKPADVLVFDACQLGLVLRAVLFVQLVTALALLFSASSALDWLQRWSLLTAGVLPATLLWLITACSLKRPLARLPALAQQGAGVSLGALAGLFACALLNWVGMLDAPPWWASAASAALLSALLVAALVLRAKARAPTQAKARLAELQARIRPHFLFNSLNSAIALVRDEPRQAERLLEDLSELFRAALAEPGESVSLADEIALAQRYLAIEQLRFGSRLRLEWALDARANCARLPPLLLQPLVENAVKHGVETSPQGAQIRVSTQRRGATVVIKISNTVNPKQALAVPGHGLALKNVQERLSLLHDVQGRFQSGLKNGVFQVRIELPCA